MSARPSNQPEPQLGLSSATAVLGMSSSSAGERLWCCSMHGFEVNHDLDSRLGETYHLRVPLDSGERLWHAR
jgi:hypothetical protein